MGRNNKVSTAVIRRLPRYYRYLSELQNKGTTRISSGALGKAMGLTASQIRQDLSCFGEFGQQGYGYTVSSLREEVAEIMGITRGNRAIILGVGNLGRALLENFPFGEYGFQIMAAFDVNPLVVGTQLQDVPVYDVSELSSFLEKEPVSVGVITVPKNMAQKTAENLVKCGIQGIWNFTNEEISVDSVVVESVHFSDSLLALSYMISPRGIGEEDNESKI
ncbi:MAG: redox-sensing transcriptional repressor Rex [Eubacteriales bacterium]